MSIIRLKNFEYEYFEYEHFEYQFFHWSLKKYLRKFISLIRLQRSEKNSFITPKTMQ